jgi:heme-degrading monooxygenase HmoA
MVGQGGEVNLRLGAEASVDALTGLALMGTARADFYDPNSYVMVSWWDSPEAFLAYQRAEDERRPPGQDLTTGPLPESGERRYFQVVEK